ncbi:hypothetical protein [Acinetobacter baumannii]
MIQHHQMDRVDGSMVDDHITGGTTDVAPSVNHYRSGPWQSAGTAGERD